ncbi:hypothetical protein [Sphingomonas sp. S6]|jgi:hypothetical protein|uniref:hypothetical protein n=1 Tax=Sphingomonas sp. S6 TaxID=3368600 RepID=UPI000FBA6334|nr:hypothetical protein [uncultured Sphingomonas sp.]RTL21003.1 MAG: hypothetical protein EKK50_03865 [Sphingomonadaceae bacterium]
MLTVERIWALKPAERPYQVAVNDGVYLLMQLSGVMLVLTLVAYVLSPVQAPSDLRDPQVGMAGRPETATEYAHNACACGFQVVVRRSVIRFGCERAAS